MPVLPFGPLEPDKGKYVVGVTPETINVVPTADGSWGPLKGTVIVQNVYEYICDENLNRITDENGNCLIAAIDGEGIEGNILLGADCTGMFAVRMESGSEALFAGTAATINMFDRAEFTWRDISGSSAPYDGTNRWSIARFGQYAYWQNGVDPEQVFWVDDPADDPVCVDNPTAPIAKVIATVGDFMMRGNLVGYPARIQWSGYNDPAWNVPTLRLADYQDMPTGDEVMGIVPVLGGAHVWMRSAIHAMRFAPESGFIYTRAPIDETVGTSAGYSICSIGQDDYVVFTDKGFYRYRGGFTNIGEGRVNRWFNADCDQDYRGDIVANVDPENNVVWFAYTRTTGERWALGYQYNYDRWCLSDMALQASCVARTFAYSYSDPPIVDEDVPRFAMINDDRRLGYLVGSNLAATLTTNEVDFAPDRSFVNGGQLISDAQLFTVTQKTTDTRGGSFRTRTAVSPSSRSSRLPLRGDGRQHKFTANIAAGDDWTTASALAVEVTGSGKS